MVVHPLFEKLKKVKLVQYSSTYFDRQKRFNKADCVIVSFPKAGRTWLRVLLARVFSSMYDKEFTIELEQLADENIPYIFMTHGDAHHPNKPLKIDRKKYRNKNVIFLVRDPRDVVISYYFQRTKRVKSPVEMDVSSFIRDPGYGVDRINGLMNLWAQNQHVPQNILIVKYEDLHRDPIGHLRTIMEFLGFNEVKDGLLEEAVSFGSFENMRKMERNNALQNRRLSTEDTNDSEAYKVRRGKVGGYVDYLSAEDLEYLNERVRAGLAKEYGYV